MSPQVSGIALMWPDASLCVTENTENLVLGCVDDFPFRVWFAMVAVTGDFPTRF